MKLYPIIYSLRKFTSSLSMDHDKPNEPCEERHRHAVNDDITFEGHKLNGDKEYVQASEAKEAAAGQGHRTKDSLDFDDVMLQTFQLPYNFSYADMAKIDEALDAGHAKMGFELQLSPRQYHAKKGQQKSFDDYPPKDGLSSSDLSWLTDMSHLQEMNALQYSGEVMNHSKYGSFSPNSPGGLKGSCNMPQYKPYFGSVPAHFGCEEQMHPQPYLHLSNFVRNPIGQQSGSTRLERMQQESSNQNGPYFDCSVGHFHQGRGSGPGAKGAVHPHIHIGRVISHYHDSSGSSSFHPQMRQNANHLYEQKESPLSAFERAIARHRSKGPKRQSNAPRKSPMKSTSRFRGVTHHCRTGRYEAHIWQGGKQIYLGGFDEEAQAALAYDIAAIKYRGFVVETNYDKSEHVKLIDEKSNMLMCIDKIRIEDLILALRRKSRGFQKGTSKYRGVTRHQKGKWEARIGQLVGKKYKYLGLFCTEEAAAEAYDRMAITQRGLDAITNFEVTEYLDLLTEEDRKLVEIHGGIPPGRGIQNPKTRYRYASLKSDTAAAAQQKNPSIHCLMKAFDRVKEMKLSEEALLETESRKKLPGGRKRQSNAIGQSAARASKDVKKAMSSANFSDDSKMPKLPQPQVPESRDCKLDCLGKLASATAKPEPLSQKKSILSGEHKANVKRKESAEKTLSQHLSKTIMTQL